MARTQSADYDKKRDAITHAAAHLFAKFGFAAASVSEIAARCEVSKSLIYHYYPSKDDILYDVMSDHMDRLVSLIERSGAAENQSSKAHLIAITKNFLEAYEGSADAQKVLLYEIDSLPARQREEILTKQRRIVAFVRAIIADGVAQDQRTPKVLSAKTMLYFGMLNWTHNWYQPDGGLNRDELATLAADTILGV